jgi:hypothetical protein
MATLQVLALAANYPTNRRVATRARHAPSCIILPRGLGL